MAGARQEQGRSRAGAFYHFFGNISPHAIFHGQEQGRSRAGAGQEQGRSRAGQEQEQGRSSSPIIAPIQNFIQIGCKT